MLLRLSCSSKRHVNYANCLQINRTIVNRSKKDFNVANSHLTKKIHPYIIDTFERVKYYLPLHPDPYVVVDNDFFKILEIESIDSDFKKKLKSDLKNFFITQYKNQVPANVKDCNKYMISRNIIIGVFIIPYFTSQSMFVGLIAVFINFAFHYYSVMHDETSIYNRKNLYDKIKSGEI